MAVPGRIMREALLASALLVRGQNADAATQLVAAPQVNDAEPQTLGGGEVAVGNQNNTRRGNGLRQLREWKAQRHAKHAADTLTVDDATAGMTPQQKDQWLADTFQQVRKDMAAKGIRTDQSPIGRVRFTSDPAETTGVTRSSRNGSYKVPAADENGVEVNTQEMQGLTIKELKSVLAHEAMHTQIEPYTTFDIKAANERTADHAAARTYGGKTFAGALHKIGLNQAKSSPNAANEMVAYGEAAQMRLSFPKESRGSSQDRQTVEQALANKSEQERDIWLQTINRQVWQDMKARGVSFNDQSKTKIEFVRGEDAGLSDAGKNNVSINETQVKTLTVRELKSVVAYGTIIAQQADPNSESSAKAAGDAAAKTYGGRTFSHAIGELHREADPHLPLHKRQDEAIKTSPGSAVGRLARWTKAHIKPH